MFVKDADGKVIVIDDEEILRQLQTQGIYGSTDSNYGDSVSSSLPEVIIEQSQKQVVFDKILEENKEKNPYGSNRKARRALKSQQRRESKRSK